MKPQRSQTADIKAKPDADAPSRMLDPVVTRCPCGARVTLGIDAGTESPAADHPKPTCEAYQELSLALYAEYVLKAAEERADDEDEDSVDCDHRTRDEFGDCRECGGALPEDDD